MAALWLLQRNALLSTRRLVFGLDLWLSAVAVTWALLCTVANSLQFALPPLPKGWRMEVALLVISLLFVPIARIAAGPIAIGSARRR